MCEVVDGYLFVAGQGQKEIRSTFIIYGITPERTLTCATRGSIGVGVDTVKFGDVEVEKVE